MIMLLRPFKRGIDDWGDGSFGASRGSRKHIGIDFAAEPGQIVVSHVSGVVTKLGYPYASDLSYRYVEVTDDNMLKHRFFYVEPTIQLGEDVIAGETVIGVVQDISSKYRRSDRKPMTNHVHYEVKTQTGKVLDPDTVI